jgi:hypothetical protein
MCIHKHIIKELLFQWGEKHIVQKTEQTNKILTLQQLLKQNRQEKMEWKTWFNENMLNTTYNFEHSRIVENKQGK